MAGRMQVPRSRGALSGLLLILLGVWGALIPFIGPYFDYAYTPDTTWHYTAGRLILEILPGAAAVLGGLLVMGSANRAAGIFGGWLAALGGAWFVLGVPFSTLWGSPTVGSPIGSSTHRLIEYIGFFGGLGVVIVFLAAFALGRFAVLGVREAERARAVPVERTERAPAEETRAEDTAADEHHGRRHWPRTRHHAGAR